MSGIRITGGRARGRVLKEAVGAGVRPTSSVVRQALFSLIGQDLAGRSVLDAFGGTGLVGLEAWSRGARVTVVEKDPAAFRAILARGRAIGAEWEVVRGDVLRIADRMGVFEGVFADPPYDVDPAPVVEALGPAAREWLVLQCDVRTPVPARAGPLSLDRVRRYGGTILAVYRPVTPADGDPSA